MNRKDGKVLSNIVAVTYRLERLNLEVRLTVIVDISHWVLPRIKEERLTAAASKYAMLHTYLLSPHAFSGTQETTICSLSFWNGFLPWMTLIAWGEKTGGREEVVCVLLFVCVFMLCECLCVRGGGGAPPPAPA